MKGTSWDGRRKLIIPEYLLSPSRGYFICTTLLFNSDKNYEAHNIMLNLQMRTLMLGNINHPGKKPISGRQKWNFNSSLSSSLSKDVSSLPETEKCLSKVHPELET